MYDHRGRRGSCGERGRDTSPLAETAQAAADGAAAAADAATAAPRVAVGARQTKRALVSGTNTKKN